MPSYRILNFSYCEKNVCDGQLTTPLCAQSFTITLSPIHCIFNVHIYKRAIEQWFIIIRFFVLSWVDKLKDRKEAYLV